MKKAKGAEELFAKIELLLQEKYISREDYNEIYKATKAVLEKQSQRLLLILYSCQKIETELEEMGYQLFDEEGNPVQITKGQIYSLDTPYRTGLTLGAKSIYPFMLIFSLINGGIISMNNYSKIIKSFLFTALLLFTPLQAQDWWLWVEGIPVMESTQLDKLAADVHKVTEQLNMLKNHIAMLNSLKSRLLLLGNGQIMQVFTEAQSVLQNAKSLTADIYNFGEAFNQHFPDEYERITSAVNEAKRLHDDWRNVQEGYIKVLHMNAQNFDNEQQIRNKIIDTLNETDSEAGQTKAIQIIGAIVNHASFLLDRNNQELSGFMESYITRQQAEKQRKKLVQKNISDMGKNAAQTERSGKSFTPGFK